MGPTGALHQLMLWYLIWGEAANLRHTPECLCLVFYCMCDALHLDEPPSGRALDSANYFDLAGYISTGAPIAAFANAQRTSVGGLPVRLRLPSLREAAPGGLSSRRPTTDNVTGAGSSADRRAVIAEW